MHVYIRVIYALILVEQCSAHLCLINPHQRGSMTGINKPGATDCILLKGPCGARPAVKFPSTAIVVKQNFTVTFQKNLDHFHKANPGYFSISVATSETSEFHQIATVADRGEPNLHLYSVDIVIPDFGASLTYVLQARYVTMNPKAPPVFYQCADVLLLRP